MTHPPGIKHRLCTIYQFEQEKMYRLAYNMDDPKLRGKAVVFKDWHHTLGDVWRCKVNLVNGDGSLGEEWLVKPSCLIRL